MSDEETHNHVNLYSERSDLLGGDGLKPVSSDCVMLCFYCYKKRK